MPIKRPAAADTAPRAGRFTRHRRRFTGKGTAPAGIRRSAPPHPAAPHRPAPPQPAAPHCSASPRSAAASPRRDSPAGQCCGQPSPEPSCRSAPQPVPAATLLPVSAAASPRRSSPAVSAVRASRHSRRGAYGGTCRPAAPPRRGRPRSSAPGRGPAWPDCSSHRRSARARRAG